MSFKEQIIPAALVGVIVAVSVIIVVKVSGPEAAFKGFLTALVYAPSF